MSHDATNAEPLRLDTPRLLVVDDDVVERMIIGKIGRQCGFEVFHAATLQEAERYVVARTFDCITIDLGLGADCGAALLGSLWRRAGLISIVVISGAEEKMLRAAAELAHALGFASHFLTKPLNLTELRAVLRDTCRSAPIQRSLNKLTVGKA